MIDNDCDAEVSLADLDLIDDDEQELPHDEAAEADVEAGMSLAGPAPQDQDGIEFEAGPGVA
jgi:hypothetical protein